jgi:hypothetical protein
MPRLRQISLLSVKEEAAGWRQRLLFFDVAAIH